MLTAIMLIVIILTVLILSFNMQRVIYLGFCCDTNYKIVLIKHLNSKLIVKVVIQADNQTETFLALHMPKLKQLFAMLSAIMLAIIMLIVIIPNFIKLSVNMRRVSQYALFCYANIKIVLIKLLYSKLMIVVVI